MSASRCLRKEGRPLASAQQLRRLYEAQTMCIDTFAAITDLDEGRVAITKCLIDVYDTPLPDDFMVQVTDVDGIPCTWMHPPQGGSDRVILYLHGGGYMMGSFEDSAEMVGRVARGSGASVLAVGYRLAPEHQYPAALDDAFGAYRWLLQNGHDSRRIVVMGDSAGGGLALAVAVRARDEGLPLPAGAALLSPFLDMTLSGSTLDTNVNDPLVNRGLLEFTIQAYLGDGDRTNPLCSPLFADLTGLPPLLIQVGGAEGLLDDARRLAGNAKECGVEVTLQVSDEMPHIFQFYAWIPEAQQATASIAEFVSVRTAA